MPLWFGMGQAANVVQLPGADAGGLISMILQAVETVRENKKECQELAKRVQVIGGLLGQLQEPDMMQEPATRNPLEELEETLRHAYTLVTHCQESNIAYLFCRATRTAKRLREVQDRIMFYLQVFPMVSHVHTTRLRQIRDVPSASDRIGGSEDIGRVPAATVPFTATETPCICSSSEFSKFSFSQLADATSDFSPENQIAKGGFSIFYKKRSSSIQRSMDTTIQEKMEPPLRMNPLPEELLDLCESDMDRSHLHDFPFDDEEVPDCLIA